MSEDVHEVFGYKAGGNLRTSGNKPERTRPQQQPTHPPHPPRESPTSVFAEELPNALATAAEEDEQQKDNVAGLQLRVPVVNPSVHTHHVPPALEHIALLHNIFTYLEAPELLGCRRVCKGWRGAVDRNGHKREQLHGAWRQLGMRQAKQKDWYEKFRLSFVSFVACWVVFCAFYLCMPLVAYLDGDGVANQQLQTGLIAFVMPTIFFTVFSMSLVMVANDNRNAEQTLLHRVLLTVCLVVLCGLSCGVFHFNSARHEFHALNGFPRRIGECPNFAETPGSSQSWDPGSWRAVWFVHLDNVHDWSLSGKLYSATGRRPSQSRSETIYYRKLLYTGTIKQQKEAAAKWGCATQLELILQSAYADAFYFFSGYTWADEKISPFLHPSDMLHNTETNNNTGSSSVPHPFSLAADPAGMDKANRYRTTTGPHKARIFLTAEQERWVNESIWNLEEGEGYPVYGAHNHFVFAMESWLHQTHSLLWWQEVLRQQNDTSSPSSSSRGNRSSPAADLSCTVRAINMVHNTDSAATMSATKAKALFTMWKWTEIQRIEGQQLVLLTPTGHYDAGTAYELYVGLHCGLAFAVIVLSLLAGLCNRHRFAELDIARLGLKKTFKAFFKHHPKFFKPRYIDKASLYGTREDKKKSKKKSKSNKDAAADSSLAPPPSPLPAANDDTREGGGMEEEAHRLRSVLNRGPSRPFGSPSFPVGVYVEVDSHATSRGCAGNPIAVAASSSSQLIGGAERNAAGGKQQCVAVASVEEGLRLFRDRGTRDAQRSIKTEGGNQPTGGDGRPSALDGAGNEETEVGTRGSSLPILGRRRSPSPTAPCLAPPEEDDDGFSDVLCLTQGEPDEFPTEEMVTRSPSSLSSSATRDGSSSISSSGSDDEEAKGKKKRTGQKKEANELGESSSTLTGWESEEDERKK